MISTCRACICSSVDSLPQDTISTSLCEMSLTNGEHISVTEEVSKPEENNKTKQVFTSQEHTHRHTSSGL